MVRALLTVILPVIVPVLVYGVYMMLARRNARLASEGRLPRWQTAPWGLILTASVLLMMASLAYWGMSSGVAPGVKVKPPSLQDGEVVPSHPVGE